MCATIPALVDDNFQAYLNQISKYPILEKQEEYDLAVRYKEEGCEESGQKLVLSHLRLVVKEAMSFRGYGLALSDLVAEGNLGLLQALKKFDPYKEFRFSTYSICWIKAMIREYVLRYWSIMKTNTTAIQRKLFFKLRQIKNKLRAVGVPDLEQEAEIIAEQFNTTKKEVISMDQCLESSGYSLNSPIDSESGTEFIDMLPDQKDESKEIIEAHDRSSTLSHLYEALHNLEERERRIIMQRTFHKAKLADLAKEYGVSAERIRQIYDRSINKLRHVMKDTA